MAGVERLISEAPQLFVLVTSLSLDSGASGRGLGDRRRLRSRRSDFASTGAAVARISASRLLLSIFSNTAKSSQHSPHFKLAPFFSDSIRQATFGELRRSFSNHCPWMSGRQPADFIGFRVPIVVSGDARIVHLKIPATQTVANTPCSDLFLFISNLCAYLSPSSGKWMFAEHAESSAFVVGVQPVWGCSFGPAIRAKFRTDMERVPFVWTSDGACSTLQPRNGNQ